MRTPTAVSAGRLARCLSYVPWLVVAAWWRSSSVRPPQMPWTCLVPRRERETRGRTGQRADRPRLGRLLQRAARGRDREEQTGIGGPAGGKLPPLAVGRQSRPLGAVRRQPGGRLVKAPRARLRPARTTASSERACMAALRRRCTCTPASRCGRPGPPAQALSPARVAPQSRAMAKAGRNQHRHGCPRTTDPAVLRSRESPGSGDAS